MKKTFFYLVALLPILIAKQTWSIVDPNIQWETLSTPHFEVIYDARHYQTARKYALRLELNHKLLSTYYTESPEKTVVILNDNTDLANGYATRVPYPHIMLFPVLPTSHESISEYSDWPQELTLHEYAHIVNFEPAHGIMKAIRYAFGNIITPTMLLPRWWHEGVAVEMETRFTTHGRLRSQYQDAALRALAKDQQLERYSIAEINESELDTWPRGARPYLFGSLLMSEIQHQKNSKVAEDLLQHYSSRIPYLINGPAEEETSKNFEEWFTQAIQVISDKTQAQLNTLRQSPTTVFSPLSPKFLESHSPQVSPDGRFLTFVAKNRWGKSSIQILDRHEQGRPFNVETDSFSEFLSMDNKSAAKNNDAPPAGNINRVAWLPDSSGFIFDQVRNITAYANFSDLHFYDLNQQKHRRITSGQRLREPGISPNGQKIVAVQLEQTNSRLVTLNLDGSDLQTQFSPPMFHKVTSPLFLSDELILFTERDVKGDVSLKTLNIANKQVELIQWSKLSQIDSLNQEAKGHSFVAMENGIQNFYFTEDQFKTYRRLTHTETAIFDGCIDHRMGTIYTTSMGSTGILVANSPFPQEPLPSPPPAITSLLDERYGQNKAETTSDEVLETEFGSQIGPKTPYSSLGFLLPRYWLPFVYMTENGYGTQISTSAFDPLEKHTYQAQAGYDSFTHESSVGLSYTNTTTEWPMGVAVAAQEQIQPILNNRFQAQQVSFVATHDLRPFSENITTGFGLDGNVVTATSSKKHLGPKFIFNYDGTAKSAFSEVPFAGYQISLIGNHFIKTSELTALSRAALNATYFYSKHLPDGHIAAINFKTLGTTGEIGVSDFSQTDAFYFSQALNTMQFVLRGYDPGYFYFKSAHELALEYHIPLSRHFGWGTLPAFVKRTRMSLFAEAMSLDGFAIDFSVPDYVRTFHKSVFSSYGVEFKSDLTLGYYFPVTVLLGLYQRPDYSGPSKTTAFIGFQI
jgi:hypothetical protein